MCLISHSFPQIWMQYHISSTDEIQTLNKIQFCLPFGNADDTPSPLLSVWWLRDMFNTWILNELDAFICKALKGEGHSELLRALNNAADESLRLALWVKIDEKKRSSSDIPFG